MFTPQRNNTPWTPPPRTSPSPTSRFTAAAKGKSVAYVDGPPPPRSSIETNNFVITRAGGGDSTDDWKRFKEVGLLDESTLDLKDRHALLDKVAKLEKELYDYQYNLGLLLLEKKDLVSKNEELGQRVDEAREILNREQAAHLMAISEVQKREENLKKALDLEKKCLVDLERALRDQHEEYAKLKSTSETTVADVIARMEALEKKRLDIEAKSRLADAKLAEADRKNSELARQLQDFEVREDILHRERLSLTNEKEAHQSFSLKQKEDLREWEKKLQKEEQRLCNIRSDMKDKEEKLLETSRTLKEKEASIEELQRKIELAGTTLKKMEDDMENSLSELDRKEKIAEERRCHLKTREKQLLEKEESLNARETVELEKLLNEHKIRLDAELHELETEMEQRRKSLEQELESRMLEVKRKEAEINHLEVKLGKKEEALDQKSERVKVKENEVELKSKDLKDQEKSLRTEEKRLEVEKKKFGVEKESLEDLRKELEMWRTKLRKEDLDMEEERKKLDALEEERSEYFRLQSNLKQEIENARCQRELIEKEAEDLKLQREKFEKDWEALDEKRAAVDNDLKVLAEEKVSFGKLRNSEEERFRREIAEKEEHLRLESERIRLEKESFEATMEHEMSQLAERTTIELSRMQQNLEQQKQDLDNDMQKSQREWEKKMEKRERDYEEMKLQEMQNISYLKETCVREKEEMEAERRRLEKEREEMESNKEELEETRIAISEDVATLDDLSKKLKKQREQLVREKNLFNAFLEKVKGCRNCGDSAHSFQLTDLEGSSDLHRPSCQDLTECRVALVPCRELSKKMSPPPAAVGGDASKLGGQMSVLQKCASIIFKSPRDKIQPTDNLVEESPNECGPSSRSVDDPFKDSPSGVIIREGSTSVAVSVDVSNVDNVQDIQESEKSDSKSRRKPGRKRGPGVRRTHSVKAVVEDAKAILGEGSAGMQELPDNILGTNKPGKKPQGDAELSRGARKRSRSQSSRVTESEQDVDHSEGNIDGVTTGGRRKRRQTVVGAAAVPASGQRRYNLRRPTGAESVTTKEEDEGVDQGTSQADEDVDQATRQAAQDFDGMPAQLLDAPADSSRQVTLMVSTTRSVEFSSDRVVRFNTTADPASSELDHAKSVENTLLSEEAKSAENTLLSEEVDRTSENVGDDNMSMVNENEDEDDTSDDGTNHGDFNQEDNDDHPGQASMRKKLWKFFTT